MNKVYFAAPQLPIASSANKVQARDGQMNGKLVTFLETFKNSKLYTVLKVVLGILFPPYGIYLLLSSDKPNIPPKELTLMEKITSWGKEAYKEVKNHPKTVLIVVGTVAILVSACLFVFNQPKLSSAQIIFNKVKDMQHYIVPNVLSYVISGVGAIFKKTIGNAFTGIIASIKGAITSGLAKYNGRIRQLVILGVTGIFCLPFLVI